MDTVITTTDRPGLVVGGMPLLRLMQLSSAALPIGAFAYSQGLEQAVASGWVSDEHSAEHWILGLLANSVGTLDLPVLLRLMRAFAEGDQAGAVAWSDFLFACRGSSELQAEDHHLGTALAKVLVTTGAIANVDWPDDPGPTYVAMFALGAARWAVPAAAAATGYAFAWTEAQVGAATRLCPLGQRSSQRILSAAFPVIERAVAEAQALSDDEIRSSTPVQAIASAMHETLYCRLCRS
jgi:urease accessory protein